MISVRKRSGFTLVEIMVALAVLVIMALAFAQITAMTSSAIHLSNQSVDASAQAYLSFDRMRMDLAALVKRTDADFLAQNPATPVGGGNLLLFLSNIASSGISSTATGTAANRNISMIAYQISTSSDNGGRPCLLRAGKPITWNNASFMGLGATGLPLSFADPSFPSTLLPSATATPSDFDIMAPGVIRMVIGFQLYPDNLAVTLADGTTPTPATAQGQIVYSPPIRIVTPSGGGTAVNYTDWKRISALVIGVVALNVDSLKVATAAQVTSLASAFPLPASGVLPLKSWTPVANTLVTLGPTTVPLPLRQTVHVFQQTFPITPYGTKGN